MRLFFDSRAGLGPLLLLLPFAAAHSWVEAVFRVDPSTRNYIGAPGFPRGGSFRRMAMNNEINDAEYIHRVPDAGVWTGEEMMNKDPMSQPTPENEVLKVSPGDFIAIQHLENGHVSLVEEGRPLNGGTIFIYGTAEPTDTDKISDIHLKWNEDGTGGDGRGRLLATRNYDDKQCYEGNAGKDVPKQRSAELGTDPVMSLPCQSDIKLPDDLKPGSDYTIYWYWDWPRLNVAEVDMEATIEGNFPWSGTYDPELGLEQPIQGAEGYTSTIDVHVVGKGAVSTKVDAELPEPFNQIKDQPDVYSQAIGGQLKDNFAVKPPSYEDGGDGGADEPIPESKVPEPLPETQVPEQPVPTEAPEADKETVTVTKIVTEQPAPTEVPEADKETVTVTETVTEPASQAPCSPTSTQTVVELETAFTTVWADEPTTMVTSTRTTSPESGALPTETTTLAARDKRFDWKAAASGFVVRPRNI